MKFEGVFGLGPELLMAASFLQDPKKVFAAGFKRAVGGQYPVDSSRNSSQQAASTRSFADVTAGRSSPEQQGDWSKLVSTKKLPCYKPVLKEGKKQIPSTVCENAPSLWEDSLIGQFVGFALVTNKFIVLLILYGEGKVL